MLKQLPTTAGLTPLCWLPAPAWLPRTLPTLHLFYSLIVTQHQPNHAAPALASLHSCQATTSPDALFEVVHLILVTLLLAAVASDRRHVEHAVAELDEGAALHGDVNVCTNTRGMPSRVQ
jgi:hypothetical protein